MSNWAARLCTRYLFFTGKGGVGKTSLASATAVWLADQGKKVFIVSTDPASNLDEVFGQALASDPAPVQGIAGLWAANLDPQQAAAAYRESVIGPYRGKLPAGVLRNMEEQFSGACTTELAAFDAFVSLMAEDQAGYDHLIFDTAPTGHTLRLLSLPGAWSEYLQTTTAETSCLGPLAGLKEKRQTYELALRRLANPELTTLVLVARPEGGSLKEAGRTSHELRNLGIGNLHLLINGILPLTGIADRIADSMRKSQALALGNLPAELSGCPRQEISLLANNLVGLAALRAMAGDAGTAPLVITAGPPLGGFSGFDDMVGELLEQRTGVILTMGKGGVGKTSVAIKVAEMLAQRGARVRLTTTDPGGDLEARVSATSLLRVSKIDPAREVALYTAEVLARASDTLDAQGLELLREDLRSPCTEEIAVFRAFAQAVSEATDEFVVIDTAPTGHTILLMDATQAYNREVSRNQEGAPKAVLQLLPRLRDPNYTHVLLVALPEPTPVHEAMALQADLRRAGIEPFAWVINRSLLASGTVDPLLASRARNERPWLEEVLAQQKRAALVGFEVTDPRLREVLL